MISEGSLETWAIDGQRSEAGSEWMGPLTLLGGASTLTSPSGGAATALREALRRQTFAAVFPPHGPDPTGVSRRVCRLGDAAERRLAARRGTAAGAAPGAGGEIPPFAFESRGSESSIGGGGGAARGGSESTTPAPIAVADLEGGFPLEDLDEVIMEALAATRSWAVLDEALEECLEVAVEVASSLELRSEAADVVQLLSATWPDRAWRPAADGRPPVSIPKSQDLGLAARRDRDDAVRSVRAATAAAGAAARRGGGGTYERVAADMVQHALRRRALRRLGALALVGGAGRPLRGPSASRALPRRGT